jgi:GntR family transcriptional regulator
MIPRCTWVCLDRPGFAWQHPGYGAGMEHIDHDAGEPVWSQLAGILRRQIERGDIAPGKLLPSISTLMQTYGLSDGTVKRALGTLRDEGLIQTIPGRGSYVSESRGKGRRS